jgi:hypothetical protein
LERECDVNNVDLNLLATNSEIMSHNTEGWPQSL